MEVLILFTNLLNECIDIFRHFLIYAPNSIFAFRGVGVCLRDQGPLVHWTLVCSFTDHVTARILILNGNRGRNMHFAGTCIFVEKLFRVWIDFWTPFHAVSGSVWRSIFMLADVVEREEALRCSGGQW